MGVNGGWNVRLGHYYVPLEARSISVNGISNIFIRSNINIAL
jgi:hypothetical protein